MTVRDVLSASKRRRTGQIFLDGLDVQSQGCEAAVWLLSQAHYSYVGVILDVHVIATNKSTATFAKETFFHMNHSPLVILECLSTVDLAWMHMQAMHKAKPSHNNTYIPRLCNSLPPRYWVFVVISRL